MATPVRSRLATDERRAQLLELGLNLFGTRAYDEVSIDDIAAAASVSKGLLYHYFGGKRDFYVATIRFAAQSLLDAIDQEEDGRPPEQRAVLGIDAYLTFVEDHADVYTALMSGGLGADPEVTAILEESRWTIIGRIATDLGLAGPRPMFQVALRAWIGGVEAAALEWIDSRDVDRSKLIQLLARSLHETVRLAAELDPDANVDVS